VNVPEQEFLMKTLLSVKATVEIFAGLAFTFFPSWVFSLLFGERFDSSQGIRASHIIGAALATLGVACWLARNDSRSHAAAGLIVALLLYDVAFVFILVSAYFGAGIAGVTLWPVVVLHSGLAICSLLCLRKDPAVVGAG
jgi:hypothetical protein